jgi:hypothetical protein
VTVFREGDFNPADRLDFTDIQITLDNARFDSWDTLRTEYTTINAGTLQLNQGRGVTENLGAGSPSSAPISTSASVGASETNDRVENLTASTEVTAIGV